MRHFFSLMKSRRRLFIAVGALAAVLMLHAAEAQASKMYWADGGTNNIEKSNLDGTSRETLGTFANLTLGIAVDSTNGHVYFTEYSGGTGSGAILRMNTDGTGVTTLTTTGVLNPEDIAIDVTGGKMYWAALTNNAIRRANLDGTGNEALFDSSDSVSFPTGLDLDIPNGKVYWTNFSSGTVQSGNMDGTGSSTNLVTGLSNPFDVKLDLANGLMYILSTGDGTIRRATLAGGGLTTLVDSTTFGGTKALSGLALDLVGGKIIFSNDTDNKIQSVTLTGTSLTDLITSGLDLPAFIDLELDSAVVPEPSTYALGLIGLAGLGLVAWRKRRARG